MQMACSTPPTRLMRGWNESSSADMSLATGAMDRVAKELGGVGAFMHHEPLVGGRPRGHSSLFDDSDFAIAVDEQRKGSGIFRVKHTKLRNGAKLTPIGTYKLIDVSPEPGSAVLGPTSILDEPTTTGGRLVQLLVQDPKLEGLTYTDLLSQVSSKLKISRSAFSSTLRSLVAEGILEKRGPSRGGTYWLAKR